MKVCTLASSSKGNSIAVFSDETKVLIDVGINLAELELKLKALNITASEINAILITHEHSDHIKSLSQFIKKYKTPTYVHNTTLASVIKKMGKIDLNLLIPFYDESFYVGEFKITSFDLPHDASKCVGFNIEKADKKISIATDFGHTTSNIIQNLYNSRLVILESNHDEKLLLANPKYSDLLKNRILGKYGHLSNNTAAKVICDLSQNNVKQVVLAHLSEENNSPELAYKTVVEYLKAINVTVGENIFVDVADPYKIGTIFHLK